MQEAAAKEEQWQKRADQREHDCHCYNCSFNYELLCRRQQLKKSNGRSVQTSVSMNGASGKPASTANRHR